jgi:hypothetical protein
MPAHPGKNRSAEKQKKKRAAAQQARKSRMIAQAARDARLSAEAQAADAAQGDDGPLGQTAEVDVDALDAANDEIAALIKKKKLDEAEEKATALAARFPRHSDGLQRLAEVLEKRGDKAGALEALRDAAKRPNDGDEEVADEIAEAIRRLGG